ncbi:MAG: N-acetyltransferase family protein [Chloroflexota bacterium]
MSDSAASLRISAVTPDTWADFERLFESKGAPSYCWCMAWRKTAEESKKTDRPSLKVAIANRVKSGTPIGLLGYVESTPVAWCSVAPRHTHSRLVSDGSDDEGTWSITCFFVSKSHRGKGTGRLMLTVAVQHALASGARVVEAYPVDPDSPSYRFMGFVSTFAKAGFAECGREGKRRHVMRLKVRNDA